MLTRKSDGEAFQVPFELQCRLQHSQLARFIEIISSPMKSIFAIEKTTQTNTTSTINMTKGTYILVEPRFGKTEEYVRQWYSLVEERLKL